MRPDRTNRAAKRSDRARLLLTFGICVLLAALPAAAHDFWIEPATFRPAPDRPLAVSLRVGDAFPGESLPRAETRVVRFELIGPEGTAPVAGVEGTRPAGAARVGTDGAYVLVYRSTDSRVELPGEKFESYLVEEGLERVSRLRADRGETAEPGREQFSRSVKALLSAGAPTSHALHTRPTGLPLELVPAASPYDPAADLSRFAVTLLWEGEPLAGALVEARRWGYAAGAQHDRTDSTGRAVFDVAAAGPWLVTAVHMTRAPANSGADWQSVWTSLTFETADSSQADGPRS